MSIVKANRLQAVLAKARNAGHVEETVCIAGLNLVFRSLAPEAYNTILEELEEVPELSYAICYQIEHVCRSIVQVDEQDFRDVEFIEVEGDSGGPAVRVERHQWIRDSIVATWSREMVTVAYRKVMDALKGADERAHAGVQFRIAEETDEEKYRRLLGELKEAGTELPDELREAILKEEGLLPATSQEELEALEARARTWAQASDEPVPETTAAASPPAAPPRAPAQLVQAQRQESEATPPQQRVPLNQVPIQEPVPVNLAEQGVVMANPRSPVPPPDQVHNLSSRRDRIAALEGDPNLLDQPEPQVDGQQARAILEKKPSGGVNSKYVDPQKNRGLNPRRV